MKTDFPKRSSSKRAATRKKLSSRRQAWVDVAPSLNGNGRASSESAELTGSGGRAARVLMTTIRAEIDVGFGNALYIRGEGDGLSWEKGLPLACIGGSTWIWWTNSAQMGLRFKLLLNDSVWSQGQDYSVAPGAELEITPVF